jgi:hypothetical protein
LWRIFHFWWRFLLPILRLRLGFAIVFSVNRLRTASKIALFIYLAFDIIEKATRSQSANCILAYLYQSKCGEPGYDSVYSMRVVRGWAGRQAGIQVRPVFKYQRAGVHCEVAVDSAGYAISELSGDAAVAK